ncbi:MAG TPA: histidine kinase, partial [Gammaproteobacteria bacterium]|nr:histidine kinase [Gammaproteobacteria bacterium]
TLANLINNAVLHAFDGGESGVIRITANSAGEGQIRVKVSDNGKGIPRALQERIFNPFVTTKMGQGGTGLGLHIAHNIVTALLGGELIVCSDEGQGSEFIMLLPEQAPRTASGTEGTGLPPI